MADGRIKENDMEIKTTKDLAAYLTEKLRGTEKESFFRWELEKCLKGGRLLLSYYIKQKHSRHFLCRLSCLLVNPEV